MPYQVKRIASEGYHSNRTGAVLRTVVRWTVVDQSGRAVDGLFARKRDAVKVAQRLNNPKRA